MALNPTKKHKQCPRCKGKKKSVVRDHPRYVWDECSKCGQQYNVAYPK